MALDAYRLAVQGLVDKFNLMGQTQQTPTGIPSLAAISPETTAWGQQLPQKFDITTPKSIKTPAQMQLQTYLPKTYTAPFLGIRGAPQTGPMVKTLGSIAAGLAPKSWGGSLGASLANLVSSEEEQARQVQGEQLRDYEVQARMRALQMQEEELARKEAARAGFIGAIPTLGLTPQQQAIAPYMAEMGDGGDILKLLAPQPKYEKVGNTLLQITPQGVTSVYEGQPKETIPAALKEFELATGTKPESRGTPEYQAAYQKFRDSKQSSMQLTPEALGALGKRFELTGEIPGMGMGKAATEARTRVLNQWASDMQRTGQTPEDQAARQAAYKASKNELSQLQAQRGKIMSFANTADKNFAIVEELSNKVDRTGVPVLNRWVLAGKRSVAGDVETAKFDAAVRTAINEYAKIVSTATGGGVTSDAARKEVENMLNTAQTKEQVQGVIDLLRREVGNRKAGYEEQISSIKSSISGRDEKGSQKASPVAPTGKSKSGRDIWLWPDGQYHYSPPR